MQENWSSCRRKKESTLPSRCIYLGGFLKSKLRNAYCEFEKSSFPPCDCPFQTSSRSWKEKQVLDLKTPSRHR